MNDQDIQVFITSFRRYFESIKTDLRFVIEPPYIKDQEMPFLEYTGIIAIERERAREVWPRVLDLGSDCLHRPRARLSVPFELSELCDPDYLAIGAGLFVRLPHLNRSLSKRHLLLSCNVFPRRKKNGALCLAVAPKLYPLR